MYRTMGNQRRKKHPLDYYVNNVLQALYNLINREKEKLNTEFKTRNAEKSQEFGIYWQILFCSLKL